MLVACGHTFYEGCLDQMLQPLPLKNGGKRLECPVCRRECRVQVRYPLFSMILDPVGVTIFNSIALTHPVPCAARERLGPHDELFHPLWVNH